MRPARPWHAGRNLAPGGGTAYLAPLIATAEAPVPPRPAFLSILLLLGACGERYSADTYSTRAVQQANQVQQGVIVGARPVQISADGTTGAGVGAAAGGIVGGAAPAGSNIGTALGAVGGGLIGGLFGSATERVVNDSAATEYVVRRANGELVSVTQRDVPPLPVGQKVLVIAGAQARIVPDYTVEERPTAPAEAPGRAEPPRQEPGAPTPLVPPEVPLAL
ncbi:hypothetical protein [Muricoccus radiodurans]|uniref:hypothetical protein n=1 Tax=Muricoccus radiodurans TaxID=2231721 RepID=UPI003CEE7F62